jgi:hypothetical protein
MLDLDIPPPTWVAASAFEHFCKNRIRGNWIVMCANTHTRWLNLQEADRLIEYFEDTHALLVDENYKAELLEILYEAEGGLQ